MLLIFFLENTLRYVSSSSNNKVHSTRRIFFNPFFNFRSLFLLIKKTRTKREEEAVGGGKRERKVHLAMEKKLISFQWGEEASEGGTSGGKCLKKKETIKGGKWKFLLNKKVLFTIFPMHGGKGLIMTSQQLLSITDITFYIFCVVEIF